MSSSASILLSLQGMEDVYISQDPDITFFRQIYTKHTAFGIQTLPVPTTSDDLNFGQQVRFIIPRKGDLVRKIYFRFTLPILRDRSSPGSTLVWTDSIGHALIEYVDLYIGRTLIDRIDTQLLEVYSDMFSDQEKQIGLKDLIGKGTYNHITSFPSRFGNNSETPDYNRNNEFIVELPFYFNRNSSLALPLVSLTLQEIELVFKLRTAEELIVNNLPGSTSSANPIWDPETTGPMKILKAELLVDYVYLGDKEIEHFKTHPVNQIITQHQLATVIAREGESVKRIRTDFTNPVKEFFFVVQQTNRLPIDLTYKEGNDYFNFTLDNANKVSGNTLHSITGIQLDLDGHTLMDDDICDGMFLAIQQPMNFHTRIPDRLIYVYSNALDPENSKPSGSINMSRVMHQNFYIYLNNSTTGIEYPERKISIYSVSNNILNIKDGLAGLVYNARN